METLTVNETMITLPADSYQELVERVERLEQLLYKLVQLAEDKDDVRVMREAEVEYRLGDSVPFDKLLAEIQLIASPLHQRPAH